MGLAARAEVQGYFAPENLGRPVARIVVKKRPAAFELVFEVR